MNPRDILGPVAGGRGICQYCGEAHNNVSYHEACECLKKPEAKLFGDSFLQEAAEESVFHIKKLVACDSAILSKILDNLISSVAKEDDAPAS